MRRDEAIVKRAAGVLTVGLLLLFAACGDDEEPQGPERASVCDAAAGEVSGRALLEGTPTRISERGGAVVPGKLGFVLSEGGCSIFTAAPARDAAEIRRGQPVEVDGLILELRPREAATLRRVVDNPRGPGEEGVPGRLRSAPGDAFVDAYAVIAVDGQ